MSSIFFSARTFMIATRTRSVPPKRKKSMICRGCIGPTFFLELELRPRLFPSPCPGFSWFFAFHVDNIVVTDRTRTTTILFFYPSRFDRLFLYHVLVNLHRSSPCILLSQFQLRYSPPHWLPHYSPLRSLHRVGLMARFPFQSISAIAIIHILQIYTANRDMPLYRHVRDIFTVVSNNTVSACCTDSTVQLFIFADNSPLVVSWLHIFRHFHSTFTASTSFVVCFTGIRAGDWLVCWCFSKLSREGRTW